MNTPDVFSAPQSANTNQTHANLACDSTTPSPAICSRPRSRAALRGVLASANVALLVLVGVVVVQPKSADAQAPVGSQRARGDYTLISGDISAGSTAAIYIIDSANQEVLTMRWDNSRLTLTTIGYRDLQADAAAIPSR